MFSKLLICFLYVCYRSEIWVGYHVPILLELLLVSGWKHIIVTLLFLLRVITIIICQQWVDGPSEILGDESQAGNFWDLEHP